MQMVKRSYRALLRSRSNARASFCVAAFPRAGRVQHACTCGLTVDDKCVANRHLDARMRMITVSCRPVRRQLRAVGENEVDLALGRDATAQASADAHSSPLSRPRSSPHGLLRVGDKRCVAFARRPNREDGLPLVRKIEITHRQDIHTNQNIRRDHLPQ